jgi:NIMA (never in mitosis gene a)-related kinase
MCALKRPFQAEPEEELVLKICKSKYDRIPKKYSRELEKMVKHCLEKDSAKRFSMAELILNKEF